MSWEGRLMGACQDRKAIQYIEQRTRSTYALNIKEKKLRGVPKFQKHKSRLNKQGDKTTPQSLPLRAHKSIKTVNLLTRISWNREINTQYCHAERRCNFRSISFE